MALIGMRGEINMKRFYLLALIVPAPVAAQSYTNVLPVVINPNNPGDIIRSTPVVNPDGTFIGGGSAAGPTVAAQGSPTSGQTGRLDMCAVVSGNQTYTVGQTQPLNCITTGRLKVGVSSAGNIDPAAQLATTLTSDLVGCKYYATRPTWSDQYQAGIQCDANGNLLVTGQALGVYASASSLTALNVGARGDLQLDTYGNLRVVMTTTNATPSSAPTTAAYTFGFSKNGIPGTPTPLGVMNGYWNGANIVPAPGDATGGYVVPQPVATASAGVTPSATTAVAASQTFKAAAGNLYGVQITTGGTAGFLMLFNATTAPADGAVTPVKCQAVAANTSVSLPYNTPLAFSTGITAVFSSTGCFTKTASATAFISGDAK